MFLSVLSAVGLVNQEEEIKTAEKLTYKLMRPKAVIDWNNKLQSYFWRWLRK